MKKLRRVMAALTLTAVVLAGCGAAENVEEKVPVETVAEAGETTSAEEIVEETVEDAGEADEISVAEEVGEEPENLEPDPTNLTYLEEYQIEDVWGDGKEYPIYAPKGGGVEDGTFFYHDHGVCFTASVSSCEYPEYASEILQMYLEQTIDLQVEDWQESYKCFDVGVGEILEKGDDRYLFLTAKNEDHSGVVYQRRMLIYMSVRDGGASVFWDMEIIENQLDEEAAPLIDEVARCYGLNLSELSMDDGTWAEQDAKLAAERQNDYKPKEGDAVLEKVEGYKYLGMTTIMVDDEGEVTCPVLVPMGSSTSANGERVSTTIHGVNVKIDGYEPPYSSNFQAIAQKNANRDLSYRNNEEYGCRNAKVSEIMPMQGQDAAVYYVVEYEERKFGTEDYYKAADINCLIQLKEKHYVTYEITIRSWDYDLETNDLLKELETAYGLDLSAWYAAE